MHAIEPCAKPERDLSSNEHTSTVRPALRRIVRGLVAEAIANRLGPARTKGIVGSRMAHWWASEPRAVELTARVVIDASKTAVATSTVDPGTKRRPASETGRRK
jgi:hypothetical protein